MTPPSKLSIHRIPEKAFEATGTLIGFSGVAFIAMQILAELSTPGKSTLSPVFISGFMMIYAFWSLYGLRFRRIAIWLCNAIAMLAQTALLILILLKR